MAAIGPPQINHDSQRRRSALVLIAEQFFAILSVVPSVNPILPPNRQISAQIQFFRHIPAANDIARSRVWGQKETERNNGVSSCHGISCCSGPGGPCKGLRQSRSARLTSFDRKLIHFFRSNDTGAAPMRTECHTVPTQSLAILPLADEAVLKVVPQSGQFSGKAQIKRVGDALVFAYPDGTTVRLAV
ncbi:hypothetical protein [Pacificoceanicola onchidii]|uniref:hypothetical protein n=1 Tax=Pacificoceanicola onchidii TaxID=2562685 RepID=UPI0010A5A0B8|nr:hypothetical protein [Pacificoceanicola onchidii]